MAYTKPDLRWKVIKRLVAAYVIASYLLAFIFMGYYIATTPKRDQGNPFIVSAVMLAPVGIPIYILIRIGYWIAKVQNREPEVSQAKTVICL